MSYSPFKISAVDTGEFALMQAIPDSSEAGFTWRPVMTVDASSESVARSMMAEKMRRLIFDAPWSP